MNPHHFGMLNRSNVDRLDVEPPQKLLRIPLIHFFSLTASTAQMAQTEEFMFQNVAYIPTVYRTGVEPPKKRPIFFCPKIF